ncbi:MAG: hypothetical protein Q4C80_04235, partial [Bacillota bacterium]|nr:hypothetical protein [Bacillota bacterium]
MISGIITYAVNIVIGAIIGALIAWIKAVTKKAKAKDVAIEQAVKSLNHDALFRCCKGVMEEETITEVELENLNHLYATYRALGMNGTGEKLYLQAKNRPIRG